MSLPAAFTSVILIWSTTPLAIKWSAMGVGFSFAVLSRMVIGTLLCWVVLLVLRIRFPLHRKARLSYLASGLSMFLAMTLTYWSAQFINSGLISVMFGLSPLITSLAAALWLKEEAITPPKLAGMLFGLLGLMLVFQEGFTFGAGATQGLIALLIAVIAQSLGLVWIKRIADDSAPLATTLGSLLVGLPLFFIAWWFMDGHLPSSIPSRAIAAIIYLGVFGSVLGFALYYYLIKYMDAGKVVLIMLITPVLALLLGHGLNNEEVLPHVWSGTACILLGLALHRWGSDLMGIFAARK